MNRRKIFYQNDDVHNLIESEGDSTLLRAGPSVLAQSASQKTLLLGSDQQASPILEADDDRPSAAVYTPYGVDEASWSWIGFTGAARDDVLMGYLLGNGYRLYNPVLMRFCSPDSFSPFMIMNSYGYCEGDPVNRSDHSGHMPNPNRARPITPPHTVGLSKGDKAFWNLINPQAGRISPRRTSIDFQYQDSLAAEFTMPAPPTLSSPTGQIIALGSSASLRSPSPANSLIAVPSRPSNPASPISSSSALGSLANPPITKGKRGPKGGFEKMTVYERDALLQRSEDIYKANKDYMSRSFRDRAIILNYEAHLKGVSRRSGIYSNFSKKQRKYVILWISRNRTALRESQ